jgi:tripartite-type tricarboxylate transporter receptor subunit TctC
MAFHPNRRQALAASLLLPLAPSAFAAWPDRPLRIIHGYAPGGSTDILARLLAEHLARELGQPVVVETKSGASGNIAMDYLAKSKPDGTTLLLATNANFAINPWLYKNLPYDVARDFRPVSQIVTAGNVLVTSPAIPVTNLRELIEHARANPGKLTYGTSGAGSLQHLCAELFQRMTGTKLVHAPYRGGAAARNDLLAGHIHLMFGDIAALPLAQTGKLRAIAWTGGKREAAAPELPTMAEAGLPGYVVEGYYLLTGPAGLPDEVVKRTGSALATILRKPEVRTKLIELGQTPAEDTGADHVTRVMKADREMWAGIIKSANIQLEQ